MSICILWLWSISDCMVRGFVFVECVGVYGRPHPHPQLGPPPPLLGAGEHYTERHGPADYGGSPKVC